MLARLTIFLGAFIAFAVEPLVGRTLLPEFGGMASVWVTCLAAFQVLLVGGYLYAHLLGSRRQGRTGVRIHLALLVLGAAWLVGVGWRHTFLARTIAGWGCPALGTLLAVLALSGVPFILLAANSSLVQKLAGGEYRLYAMSNLGSFAGLLAYPFLLEPYISVTVQWHLLGGLTLVYAGLLGALAGRNRETGSYHADAHLIEDGEQGVMLQRGVRDVVLWLSIPALTCFALNAVTAFLTTSVTPIPLMWVYVLALYLLTYVLGFSDLGSRILPVLLVLGVVAVLFAAGAATTTGSGDQRFLWNLAACSSVIVFTLSGLHAWLYKLRPNASRLTLYYLCLAVGGGVGGVLSSLVAPLVFTSALEYPLALLSLLGLSLYAIYTYLSNGMFPFGGKDLAVRVRGYLPHIRWACLIACGLFAVLLYHQQKRLRANVYQEGRTFYGAWCLSNEDIVNQYGKKYPVNVFVHGGTTHGMQPRDEFHRKEPTVYYGPLGGGLAIQSHPRYKEGKPLRVALVGLGIGVQACYGRPGDVYRFYEICPEVMKLAEEGPFDYLRICKATREMVLGDARKKLEEEDRRGDEKYDVISLDVFSGDSISMYLVTQEAFALYRRRLKPGGILTIHITNWNVDLRPVMKAGAKSIGMNCEIAVQPQGLFTFQAMWAIMYEKRPAFPVESKFIYMDDVPDVELPTDERGSLVPYLMFFQSDE